MTTTIYYFIPSDGDDETHPNMYKIPSSSKGLTLAKIAQVRRALFELIISILRPHERRRRRRRNDRVSLYPDHIIFDLNIVTRIHMFG